VLAAATASSRRTERQRTPRIPAPQGRREVARVERIARADGVHGTHVRDGRDAEELAVGKSGERALGTELDHDGGTGGCQRARGLRRREPGGVAGRGGQPGAGQAGRLRVVGQQHVEQAVDVG
jgi:hypothetical protein